LYKRSRFTEKSRSELFSDSEKRFLTVFFRTE